MRTLTYAGARVEVDDDGFLVRPDEWSPDVAQAIALLFGVALTPDHWHVVNFVRERHAVDRCRPDLERIGVGTGFDADDLHDLFPGTPEVLIGRIAGIPRAALNGDGRGP